MQFRPLFSMLLNKQVDSNKCKKEKSRKRKLKEET